MTSTLNAKSSKYYVLPCFLKNVKIYFPLEMLFVPHCTEQNSVLQASWDYDVGNYLNDPVNGKIWSITECIIPKQG